MATAYQYDASGYFAGAVEDYDLLPNNATSTPPKKKNGFIPHWNGIAWEHVENHKGEEGYLEGQPYTVKEYGPLPEAWSATPPPPILAQVREAKQAALKTRYEQALAGAVALADPSPVNVALEAALWAAEDAEGLQYVRDKLAEEYKELEAAIAACNTAEALEAVEITFSV